MKDEYPLAMTNLLEHYNETKDLCKFKELEKEAIDTFKSNDTVMYIIFYHYYEYKDKKRLRELNDIIGTSDARSLNMKGRYYFLINDEDLRDKYLNDALQMDNAYFDVYLYLTSIYKGKDIEKYKYYMEKAIKTAACRWDLFDCYKDLIGVEIQDFVKRYCETNGVK